MYRALEVALISDSYIADYKPSCHSLSRYMQYLKSEYGFGSDTLATTKRNSDRELIFDIAIRPLLKYSVQSLNVDLYSALDHYLFSTYICQIEDISWFSKAFWDINSYGLAIARKISNRLKLKPSEEITAKLKKSILFVFKGPFSLAHSDVLHDFLSGVYKSSLNIDVHLLLLDNAEIKIRGINVISFKGVPTSSQKIEKFIQLCKRFRFYNIVWVACIQNLSLYMGLNLSEKSTYWTMKRHSIVFPEINKYATFISQYRNTQYNNAYWYGGRYRLKVVPSIRRKEEIIDQIKNLNVQAKSACMDNLIFGSLARSQKYQQEDYWIGIEKLLERCKSSIFIYGTNKLTKSIQDFINSSSKLSKRSYNFGWLAGNTADIASIIDIYVDTIPFGSGLTAAECILSNGCYLGTISDINKEASFTNIIVDAINLLTSQKIEYNQKIEHFGLFDSYEKCTEYAQFLYNNPDKRKKLKLIQEKLLKNLDKVGSQYFTSDYLNYFAD